MIQIDSGVFVKSRMETGDCFIFMEMEFAGLEINAGHQSVISKYLPQTRKTFSSVSAASKYYTSASHHEQKNKKTTGQIKFLAVTRK